jgi:hypothetical protein
MIHLLLAERPAVSGTEDMSEVRVHCYSGRTYAERPVAFFWQGEELAVAEVLAEWREPAGPAFRVSTARGEFVLQYEELSNRWWLREG